MPNRNKIKGDRLEYRIMHELEKEGFYVIRHPRSQFPDLFAMKSSSEGGFTILKVIECKTHKEDLTKQERKALLVLAERLGGTPWLAYRPSRNKVKLEMVMHEE